jgi:hypothetical protein
LPNGSFRAKNKQPDLINTRMMQRIKIRKNTIFILPEFATRTRNFPDTARSRGGARTSFVLHRLYEAVAERYGKTKLVLSL